VKNALHLGEMLGRMGEVEGGTPPLWWGGRLTCFRSGRELSAAVEATPPFLPHQNTRTLITLLQAWGMKIAGPRLASVWLAHGDRLEGPGIW
jgi:hypothetical protein